MNKVKKWSEIADYLDKEVDKSDGSNKGRIQWTNQWICWIVDKNSENVKYMNGNLVTAH